MRLLQISDPHIFSVSQEGKLLELNTRDSFDAVLSMALKSSKLPDVVVLSGDLAQDKTVDAYHYIAEVCEQFACSVYWIPGNHDMPALMQKIFVSSAYAHMKAEKTVLLNDHWLLVLLDTHYPGHVAGLLSQSELIRLAQSLDCYPDKNTLIFLHHHPVPVGSTWLDNLGLLNAQDLFAIIDQHAQVRGLVCGHVHQAFETQRQGVKILASPSTCIQFASNSQTFALSNQNPGYRWIELLPNGLFETGIQRLENFVNTANFDLKGYT